MRQFSSLSYYAHPPLPKGYLPSPGLVADIGILAGRLHFEFSEYAGLAEYICGGLPGEEKREDRGGNGRTVLARFCPKPREFVAEWLGVCRKGQDISRTPMGYLLQGRRLRLEDGFFRGDGEGGVKEEEEE
jgi:hypothetical protein